MTEDEYNERQEQEEEQEEEKPKLPRFREYVSKEEFIDKDMKVDHPKIKQLLDNWDDFIDELVAMTDKVLSRKLRIVQTQLMMAVEQQKMVERDALYLFKQMIIEARMVKNEIECATGIYEEEDIAGSAALSRSTTRELAALGSLLSSCISRSA